MHPFLDPKSLSDDEILERLGKAYTYMNEQKSLGHNPTVHSILEVIQTLEDERASRTNRTFEEEFSKKYPDINNPIEVGKIEE